MNLNNVVVVDTETSGPDPFSHQLLSVSFSPINEGIECLDIYIRPDDIVWSKLAKEFFKKYENKWLKKSVSSEQAYRLINNYLNVNFDNKVLLLGHNVGFDLSFLKKLAHSTGNEFFKNISYRSIDTHTLLFLYSIYHDKNISDLSGALEYFDIFIANNERHTALGDAIATKKLFNKLLSELKI